MTTHLKIRNGQTNYDTFTPDRSEMIEVDMDHIDDFDYTLNRLAEVVNGAAYVWDGPQTMRLVAYLAISHLAAHGQSVNFDQNDIDAIKEANAR